jgi:serine/threonine-protein kinase
VAATAAAFQNPAQVFKLPDGQQFTNTGRQLVSISPDGAQMVYVANTQLHLRRIGQSQSTPIAGTLTAQGITNPVFSPDGRSIAYWSGADQAFKRVPVEGGTPVTLFKGTNPFGMSWNSDGRIVVGQGQAGIISVPEAGGPAETIIPGAPNEIYVTPQLLPGNEALIFSHVTLPAPSAEAAKIVVQSLKTGQRKTLIDPGRDPRYLPSGHLIFARGEDLMAVRFDAQRLEVAGEPVKVLEKVQSAGNGSSHFSVASNGTLTYIPPIAGLQLSYVTLDGKTSDVDTLPASTFGIRVSHDGKQLVFNTTGADEAVWIYDFATRKQRQLVKAARGPLWTLDDKRVLYIMDNEPMEKLFWQNADGSDQPQLLADIARAPESWSSQDQLLSFITRKVGATLDYDIWTYSLRDKKVTPLIETPVSAQHSSRFSPDGKWIAYVSNETGTFEVYVQPFPLTGAKYKISKKPDSLHPVWSPDGRQLYFDDQQRMYSAEIRTQPSFQASEPVAMPISGFVAGGVNTRRQWDMTPDGKQFIMLSFRQEIRTIQRWADDVRSKVR